MRFKIHRVSQYFNREKSPCDGCIEGPPDMEYERKSWTIEIASLDDLLALIKREGKIVVRGPDPEDGEEENALHAIEIYDDWRE